MFQIHPLMAWIHDERLQTRGKAVVGYAKQHLLSYSHVQTPTFTDHGERHCLHVEGKAAELVRGGLDPDMTEYEALVLLWGCWLHDVGMLSPSDQGPSGTRGVHHEAGADLVGQSLPDLPLDADERYMAAELVRAHRRSTDLCQVKQVYNTQYTPEVGPPRTVPVRLRCLAAILRLADALDIAQDRSSFTGANVAGLSGEARTHHEMHQHVSAVMVQPDRRRILVAFSAANQVDADAVERFVLHRLDDELQSVRTILAENSIVLPEVVGDRTINPSSPPLPEPVVGEPAGLSEVCRVIVEATGCRPSTALRTADALWVWYETPSRTPREVQVELLSVLRCLGRLALGTVSSIHVGLEHPHAPAGQTEVLPWIMFTVNASREHLTRYATEKWDPRELWGLLSFTRANPLEYLRERSVSVHLPYLGGSAE